MQFRTEIPFHPIAPKSPFPAMNSGAPYRAGPWPGLPRSVGSGPGGGATSCMEQLLVHCATAIEANDATLTQQILWVLNNIASPDGDSNHRLACAFLRALIARAASKMPAATVTHFGAISTHRFSIIELAAYVDLTPWHRFGFTAANAAILGATRGYSVIHIVDLSSTHCMQIPTLIDAMARNQSDQPPPIVKLTVAGTAAEVPPVPDFSYEELGLKLVGFARSRNVHLEFRVIPSSSSDGFSSLIGELQAQQQKSVSENRREALVINCHMVLRCIPEETNDSYPFISSSASSLSVRCSPREMFLDGIRSLEPAVAVVVDEDADLTSSRLVGRLRSAFNYLWIPYDVVEAFLPEGSEKRKWVEGEVDWKIGNVIGEEGRRRVERAEPMGRWGRRMKRAGFGRVGFGDEAAAAVKRMLEEHSCGWGMKNEEDGVVLTWKGHNAVFASAWVPTHIYN